MKLIDVLRDYSPDIILTDGKIRLEIRELAAKSVNDLEEYSSRMTEDGRIMIVKQVGTTWEPTYWQPVGW